jgi:hypothetical protein
VLFVTNIAGVVTAGAVVFVAGGLAASLGRSVQLEIQIVASRVARRPRLGGSGSMTPMPS